MPAHRIAFDLKCVRCKYALRGLDALTRCPECGTTVMNSVVEAIDPTARKFAALTHPVRDGLALVMANGSLLAALAAASAPIVARAAIPGPTTLPGALETGASGVATAFSCLGLASAIALLTQNDPLLKRELDRYRWMLVWGMALVVLAVLTVFSTHLTGRGMLGIDQTGIRLGGAAIALAGGTLSGFALRRVFAVLGRRCRDYKRAHQGRQSIEVLMIAGAALVATGTAAAIMARLRISDSTSLEHSSWMLSIEFLSPLATILSVVLLLAVLAGLAYTTINAWWIARTLMQESSENVFTDG